MNLKNFVAGVEILLPYYNKPDGCHLGAEHDQIYLYATDAPLTDVDVARMRELGWFQPEQDDDGQPYDQEDGWSAFV